MRTWIARYSLRSGFAGKVGPDGVGEPTLDKIKAMKRLGWDLTVLIDRESDLVIVLGWKP